MNEPTITIELTVEEAAALYAHALHIGRVDTLRAFSTRLPGFYRHLAGVLDESERRIMDQKERTVSNPIANGVYPKLRTALMDIEFAPERTVFVITAQYGTRRSPRVFHNKLFRSSGEPEEFGTREEAEAALGRWLMANAGISSPYAVRIEERTIASTPARFVRVNR